MRAAYQYRLRSTQDKSARMENGLNLCRMQYNYRLRERFDWWDHHRTPIDFCPYKTATQLLSKYDVIAHEDLNIIGLAKTHLSRSILDAGWGIFIDILTIKAERAGRLAVAVNPSGTTQECSGCGVKVPKTLKDRWHSCPECGLELDRDHNAAKNIKQRAEGHPVLKS